MKNDTKWKPIADFLVPAMFMLMFVTGTACQSAGTLTTVDPAGGAGGWGVGSVAGGQRVAIGVGATNRCGVGSRNGVASSWEGQVWSDFGAFGG